ncbi:methyl-accepting chemotaxis protein [Acidovorax soli]|uniref:Methyl-accepting chemotaxis protein n=1 Tax=Acidovorax soli TaxID=592050 RepID=A0A7X0U717_9BURK|nr:methyl-accepting chemotaxis protein [Acidovorax soli]MBB6557596.1 methyl-accepting chemotaxis protein [Acidovorax soli]
MADSAKLQRMDWGVHDALQRIGRRADLIVLGIVALGWVVALWVGLIHGRPGTAAAWGALLTGAGALAFWLAPGTLLSRLVIGFCGMAMVALHLQLSLGQPEFHFGVFVFLAFLLAYRDWRPVLFAALVIAVHHVAFDRLQLAGLPLYCLSEPDFARILVHAAFVVVQATVEVLIALRMRGDAIESAELQQLCRPQADGQLSLDVGRMSVSSPTAMALRDALLRLNNAVADVQLAAESMSSASGEIAVGNQDLSQRTERTAAHLQEAAASMEQLGGMVSQSVQEAVAARDLATEASEVAERCGGVVSQVVSTMQGIQASAKRIADIVGVIDGIAFQTNILALNAAVEAARAGEQGRGFAVVASEVRALASRSADAAREVRGLITESLQQADRGASLVVDAGRSMEEVVGHARDVSQRVGTISSAVEGQSGDLHKVNTSVNELDQMTQQNAALVEQSAAAAASLRQQAARLLQVVDGFQFAVPHTALRALQ